MNQPEPNQKVAKLNTPGISVSVESPALLTSNGLPVVGAEREIAAERTERPALTDGEAEEKLPGYPLAFADYHIHRAGGASPAEALQLTLAEWRAFWREIAYVPHRVLGSVGPPSAPTKCVE